MDDKNKKAIIFDFGNVIAFFDYEKVVNNFVALSNGLLSPGQVRAQLFAEDLLERFEVGSISKTEFIEEVRQRLNLGHVLEDEIVRAWCNLFTSNQKVVEVIQRIPANIMLVLGSTTNPIHFEYYRREFADVLDRFEAFVTSFEVGLLKPNSVFYELCVSKAKCAPNECIYIDDIPSYVEAASKLGIEGIVYDTNTDLAEKLSEKGIKLF